MSGNHLTKGVLWPCVHQKLGQGPGVAQVVLSHTLLL